MQQDHAESKAEEKSAGAPGRGKTSSDKTSQARAVLSLQNTAGNRAMARILGSPAGVATMPRPEAGAVNVQRDEWTDALRKELGGSRVIDFEALAKALVRATGTKQPSEPTTGTEKSKEESGTKKEKSSSEKVKSGSRTPVSDRSVAKKRADVRAREKRLLQGPSKLEKRAAKYDRRDKELELRELRRGPTREETELRDLDEQLKARKAEQTESESLREREAKLRHRPSAGEQANQTKKAELDRFEKDQELAELKRKMSGLTPRERADQELDDQLEDLKKQQREAEALRKWERQRKPLNPGGKSLSELRSGGPRVWRG